jgi:hypothetical protein
MFRRKPVCLALGALFLIAFATPALAEECDFTWILINTDGSKPSAEQHAEKDRKERECKKRLADEKRDGAAARARLGSEFEIDSGKLTDGQAIARLAQELDARKRAEEDARARREALAQSQQADQVQEMIDRQGQMLRGVGVNLDDDDEDDGGVDPIELQMYQEMLKNGIAPECKGKKDQALIDCVDAVLEQE